MASTEPNDQNILQLLHNGEYKDAFKALRTAYQGKLYRLCLVLLRDRARAEEVLQESLLRIHHALDRYDGRASLYSWIYTITRNQCCTALARYRHDPLFHAKADWESTPESAAASDPDPQEMAIRQDDLEQVRELVDCLPELYRPVILLFYWEDRSVSEVANLLGLREGTVKTRLRRARFILEDRLRRRGLDDIETLDGTPINE